MVLHKDIIGEILYYCDFLTKHRLKQINKSSYQFLKITYISKKYKGLVTDSILQKYSDIKFLMASYFPPYITSSYPILTDKGIKHLNLYMLIASWNTEITDEGIKHMNLRIIDASNWNGITDEGIKHMNLNALYISDNEKITDGGIEHMNLDTLDASWNTKITNRSIKSMNLHASYASKELASLSASKSLRSH